MPQQPSDPYADPTAGLTVAQKPSNIPPGFWASLWKQANPQKVLSDLWTVATTDPGTTLISLVGNTINSGKAAWDAALRGDAETMQTNIVRAIPFLGEPAVLAQEQARRGNWLGAGGTLAGMAVLNLAPAMAGRIPRSITSTGILRPKGASIARSTDFALAEGIPLPLDAATGSKTISYIKNAGDAASMLSLIDRVTPVAQAFKQTGQKLAREIRPGLAETAESAGAGIADQVLRVVAQYRTSARGSYGDYEAIEAAHAADVPLVKNGVPVERPVMSGGKPVVNADGVTQMEPVVVHLEAPVEVVALKNELKPVWEKMQKDPYYTSGKQMYDPGYKAMTEIMEGPDTVALATLRNMKSWLGREQVGTEAMGARTSAQGLAAYAGGKVRKTIYDAVDALGPDAGKALREAEFSYGNAKRIEKMFEKVQSSKGLQEPVGLFNSLVLSGDKRVATLRRIRAVAPDEMTALGRAWFEDRMVVATTKDSMEHTAKMLSDWEQMGPKTREILFPDPVVRHRVGDFFAVMERWGKSPNPSGTGGFNAAMQMLLKTGLTVGGGAGAATGLGLAGLAGEQLLLTGSNAAIYSPAVVRKLVQGFTMPLPRTAARVVTRLAQVSQAAPDIQRPGPILASPTVSSMQDPDAEIKTVLQGAPSGEYTHPTNGSVWVVGPDGAARKVR
jgi:hypothetical protein